MEGESAFTLEVRRSLERSLDALTWCLSHTEERRVATRLRQVAISLDSVAIALDYEMSGSHDEAVEALQKSDWRVRLPFDH